MDWEGQNYKGGNSWQLVKHAALGPQQRGL